MPSGVFPVPKRRDSAKSGPIGPGLAVIIEHSSWTVGHAIPAVASLIACVLLVTNAACVPSGVS